MKVLNFASNNVNIDLVNRNKSCTVRLGDKSLKYIEGAIVWVTLGQKFARKRMLYMAMIDKVLVKPVNKLTEKERLGVNSDIKNWNDMCTFLKSMYQKESILESDIVTVVYFSELY
ncbi:MAG: hypothetical protein H6Q73_4399 [Firmicutes bacterium]|nr:hypothetical protein [Bacillota bacterium]